MKARRLPMLVDAHQWFPPGNDRHDAKNTPVVACPTQPGEIYMDCYPVYLLGMPNAKTAKLNATDWIIRRTYADGTTCVYVISDEAFKRGYELVPTAAEILGIPS